jgi:hypothetical protein
MKPKRGCRSEEAKAIKPKRLSQRQESRDENSRGSKKVAKGFEDLEGSWRVLKILAEIDRDGQRLDEVGFLAFGKPSFFSPPKIDDKKC